MADSFRDRPLDERVIPGPTFVMDIAHATEIASDYRRCCEQGYENQRHAAREFSLAITALEEAQMRFTRGYAHLSGKFSPVDLEAIDTAKPEAEHG